MSSSSIRSAPSQTAVEAGDSPPAGPSGHRREYTPPTLPVLGTLTQLTGAVSNFNMGDGGKKVGMRRSG